MVTRVAHVAIEVPDVDRTVEFYERYIGLAEVERDGDTVYLTCNDRHHELIVMPSPSGETGLNHLGLEVSDVAEAVAGAVAAGADAIGPVDEPGIGQAAMVKDPFGFTWKLFNGMQTVPRPEPLAVPRPHTFSHYNLAAPDVAGLSAFIVDGLGMVPSDWLGSKADPFVCWFHAPLPGSLHHGIAIINTPTVQLHHMSFEYESVGDVAKRVDNYVTRDRVLVWGMGRHGTGGGIFSYVEDPAGLMIELSAEMIRIGEDSRWSEAEVWDMDDPRGVNSWGDPVPDRWVAHGIPLARSTSSASA
jgi:catechol 2,3-dioxygenase-like lactoylglutathione lyase family enzyme